MSTEFSGICSTISESFVFFSEKAVFKNPSLSEEGRGRITISAFLKFSVFSIISISYGRYAFSRAKTAVL
jgi:hypothetical protein